MPVELTHAVEVEGIESTSVTASWAALRARLDAAQPDVEAIMEAFAHLRRVVTELITGAESALRSLDSAWQPLHEQTIAVLAQLKAKAQAEARNKQLSDARRWLKGATDAIRTRRLREFETQATAIWEGLRQESNVSLSGISLAGSNTRRRVNLNILVDGSVGKQGMLSQGELSALGLSLFLPRSTAEESPFRFALVDDPVQSLDPTKVEGLARVLHQIAQERQVVVFTHDDRLLQAVKRLALPSTALAVSRGEQSVVAIQPVTDPAAQHLRDADAISRGAGLPEDLVGIVVTGYCRDALDEAAMELVRRRGYTNGQSLSEVDASLQSAVTTRDRLALALVGGQNQRRLDAALRSIAEDARATVAACAEGVHGSDLTAGEARQLVVRTTTLVDAMRAL